MAGLVTVANTGSVLSRLDAVYAEVLVSKNSLFMHLVLKIWEELGWKC